MNIFEGGRRIAKVIMAMAVLLMVPVLLTLNDPSFSSIADYIGSLAGGLIFVWAFTWGVGWIVRGFMGIPRGSDQKPLG